MIGIRRIKTAKSLGQLRSAVLLWLEEVLPFTWYDIDSLTDMPNKRRMISMMIKESCTPELNNERGFDVTFSEDYNRVKKVPNDPDYKPKTK